MSIVDVLRLYEVIGFLMEYVASTLVEEIGCSLVVDVVCTLVVVVEKVLSLVPTQYEYVAQKLVMQSSETAGFKAMNFACVR